MFKIFALAVAGALWGAWLVLALREKGVNPIREVLDRFSRLKWICKVGVLFIVVQMTMFGGAKHGGTNDVDDAENGEAYPPSEASSEGGARYNGNRLS